MQSIKQFFDYMNDVDFPYVVLRNWENLPHSVDLGPHSDLDLLVYDLKHWQEIFPQSARVYPHPRVQFRVPIRDNYMQVDVRYVGDGYYPDWFQKAILNNREKLRGFYIPDVTRFQIALMYHCVHHKNGNNYPEYLGDATIIVMSKALQEAGVGWVQPLDPSVGQYNQYISGATSIVEMKGGVVRKKQVSYNQYNLIENEYRILNKCKSRHFPEVKSYGGGDPQAQTEREIDLEYCGDPLTVDNLPPDWMKQLVEIVIELRKHNVQHRDIKPDNLMVKAGTIKLIDFGWARFEIDPSDSPPEVLGVFLTVRRMDGMIISV